MNYEFIEGDLVYVKNEVIIPANEYMIDSFGGRVFTIKRIVTDRYSYNYKGYYLTKNSMSGDCPSIDDFVWSPDNLIPYHGFIANFDGIDELI